jgi:hypothetical protein
VRRLRERHYRKWMVTLTALSLVIAVIQILIG